MTEMAESGGGGYAPPPCAWLSGRDRERLGRGRGYERGRGGRQSVDRCTDECYWFSSCLLLHQDGSLPRPSMIFATNLSMCGVLGCVIHRQKNQLHLQVFAIFFLCFCNLCIFLITLPFHVLFEGVIHWELYRLKLLLFLRIIKIGHLLENYPHFFFSSGLILQ